MQAHLYGFVVVAFFDDVGVGYDGLKAEVVLEFLGWDGLDAGVDDWEQQRCFNCAAFGF